MTGDKAVVLRENYFRHRPESDEEVSQVRYEKDLIAYLSRSTFTQIFITLLFRNGVNA